jgi:hypothetical protein
MRESLTSGSVEGVMSDHDSYSDREFFNYLNILIIVLYSINKFIDIP